MDQHSSSASSSIQSRAPTPTIVAENASSSPQRRSTFNPSLRPLSSNKKPLKLSSRPKPLLCKPSTLSQSPNPAKRPHNKALKHYNPTMPSNWTPSDRNLRPVPSFYPLEKSSRHINDKPSSVASRLSDCCRLLSLQAKFDNDLATADLITEEHVEIHVTLWKGEEDDAKRLNHDESDNNAEGVAKDAPDKQCDIIQTTIVEAQRRTGCAVVYHRYCRDLLDAATGCFDGDLYAAGKSNSQYPRVERHPNTDVHKDNPKKSHDEGENSLLALEIAASLLSKDRMDARQLGMESLCLLTDPTKTGVETAVMASQIVLFGSVQGGTGLDEGEDEYMPDELGIREAILSLVQFGRLGEYGDFDSDGEGDDGNPDESVSQEEKESNQLLHNLALAVLANALDVLENYSNKMGQNVSSDGNGVSQAKSDSQASVSASAGANTFLEETKEISNRELLKTLLNVLGRAESKPHDACLSAQCLRSLFQASKEAKRKARDMNAKQIVMTALDVGKRTHVKLETETKNIMDELERNDDDEGQQQRGVGGSHEEDYGEGGDENYRRHF